MKLLIVAILLLLPGLVLAQTPLKSGGNTKLIPGPGSRVSRQEVTNGIVGWWKLNEGTGTTAADSSGNGNTGTLTGGPTWTNALYGGLLALSFDGSNDYVDVGTPANLNLTSAFTLALWSKPLVAASVQMISKGYDGANTQWQLVEIQNGASIQFAIQTFVAPTEFGVTSVSSYAINSWRHVVGTFDGTTYRIYVDGVLDNSAAGTAPTSTAMKVEIGAVDVLGTPSQFFTGSIDDVRIYNRALTLKEIQLLFTNNPQ